MNFYQRRLCTLSKRHFILAQHLNILNSRISNLVLDSYSSENFPFFFLTKKKDWCMKEIMEKIMEVENCGVNHARQIILIKGQDKLKEEMGL